jgi:hypothetical protein
VGRAICCSRPCRGVPAARGAKADTIFGITRGRVRLSGLRWEGIIAPFGLTIFAMIAKGPANLPTQEPLRWGDLQDRHRLPWKMLVLALIAFEAVLLLFIRPFGNGRELVGPYAAWIALRTRPWSMWNSSSCPFD